MRTGLFLPLALLFAAATGRADGPVNELDSVFAYFRAQPGYNPVGGFGIGYRGVGYGRVINDWFELTGRLRFTASLNTDQAAGRTVLEATVGPTLNFGPNHQNLASDFYISLGAGLNYTSVDGITVPGTFYTTDTNYSTNLALSFEFGKRFQVLPNVSLKPSLSISWIIGSDIVDGASSAVPAYSLNPLEISILF